MATVKELTEKVDVLEILVGQLRKSNEELVPAVLELSKRLSAAHDREVKMLDNINRILGHVEKCAEGVRSHDEVLRALPEMIAKRVGPRLLI